MVPVKLIMIPIEQVRMVDRDESVQRSAELMRTLRIGSLLVTKDSDVLGIVTETDLVRRVLAASLDPSTTTVERVMSAPVLQVEADASLLDANDLMAQEGVRHLGVQRDGRLVGLVSVRDLVNFLTKYPRS